MAIPRRPWKPAAVLIAAAVFTLSGPNISTADALDCKAVNLPPTTKNDFKCIDKGFKVFTEETFNGNGRTCATCHIPSESYNIFPATIKKLSKKEKDLVFATNVPGLENKQLVKKFGLFNIAGDPESDAEDTMQFFGKDQVPPKSRHKLPIFRSTMGIFGLDVTTVNQANGFPGTPLFPAQCSAGTVAQGLPQLGWSGDGSPGTPVDDVACRTHHGFEDPDADGSIRAFASGAIAQHSPKSLARVPGVDFRRATALELDSMAVLQRWLGRRALSQEERDRNVDGDSPSALGTEFDLTLLQFKHPAVVKGRDHYIGGPEWVASPGPGPPGNRPSIPNPAGVFGAGCNGCHLNAGGLGPIPNQNVNVNTEVEKASPRIGNELFGPDVELPHDEGAANSFGPRPPAGPGFDEAFNTQSVIEAAQKKAWFHNHRVLNDFEEALAFYGSEDFVNPNNSPIRVGIHTSLEGLKNGDPNGNNHFPKGDGIEHLGAFLRSLNAYYNLRDCERLVKESIARIEKKVSSKVSQQHCEFNLNNARRVLKGIKLKKKPHQKVANAVPFLVAQLKLAQKTKSKLIYQLALKEITKLKKSIATRPPAPAPGPLASAN